MSLCGLASVAAAGRMLFAFSRDHGVPGSPWLRKVSHRFRTPANAIVAIVVFSYLLTNAAFIAGGGTAIAIVTAISTIALYWAYGVPIFLGIFGKQEWRDHAVWKLGRFSRPIAGIACLWIALISVLFLWPTSGNPWTLIAYVVFLGVAARLLLRLGAQALQGPDRRGRGSRADRDRARVRARGRGARRRGVALRLRGPGVVAGIGERLYSPVRSP